MNRLDALILILVLTWPDFHDRVCKFLDELEKDKRG